MKRIYFKKLDAIRFFAFFLVFWQHGFANSFTNIVSNKTLQTITDTLTITGGIGVHVFFVISGFLITFLMIEEERINGYVNLNFFYIRRILRIWPLYYLILILGIFVLPNLFNTFRFDGSTVKNLLFLNNFDMSHPAPNVGITWSVAIEEQFYLFWPIIFIVFKNKNALLTVSFSLFVLSLFFIIQNPSLAYFHTFANINYLMAGCIGAILYTNYKQQISESKMMSVYGFYFLIFAFFLFIILSSFYKPVYFLSLIVLPLLYVYIVIYTIDRENGRKIFIFSYLGKYTYGMYLYHPVIIIFIKIFFDLLKFDYIHNAILNNVLAIISLIVTVLISIFSYEYFEKPILNFKNNFSLVKTRV